MNIAISHSLLLLAADGDMSSAWCGPQSALDPAGPQAARISGLWWDYFWVCAAVYGIVMLLIVVALVWKAYRTPGPPMLDNASGWETLRAWLIGGGLVATTTVLFVLLVGDHVSGRALRSLPTQNAIKIRVTGHQWWWEFRYEDPANPSNILTTANEIHIPIGRPIDFELQSADVIHSFWIPNLSGKRDMLPARSTHAVMQADRAGTFWGQCAEFCGHQHAKMRFEVTAEPEPAFQKWLDAQRQPAAEPKTERQQRGQQIFLSHTCVMCHTIQGTLAGGMIGPELTHIASRSKLAAGSLPNTRGYLAGWISDAQQIKPGVRMPPNALAPDELRSLLEYLENLK